MTVEPSAPPRIDANDPLQRCLDALVAATDAAEALGVSVDVARAAHDDATRRLGFPSDAYVLALVGGTGVGKSSLLNALAGDAVSAASARRPTTQRSRRVDPGAGGRCVVAGPCLARRRCDPHARRR